MKEKAQCTLPASNLIHRDFRAGDELNPLAEINKAQTLPMPAVKVGADITATIPWYVGTKGYR